MNPAPSRKIPLLAVLNQRFRDAGIQWKISVTHGLGDGHKLAKKAVKKGVDLVVAYGGDGTVMEVASGLVDSNIPLLIIPGGTGNLVAAELKIPERIEQVLDLVCRGQTYLTRSIDVGMLDEHPFLLRVGAGFESEVVQEATRELKNQFGKWAYVFAGIKALQQSGEVAYEIQIDDGEPFVETGVAFVVANTGTVGIGRVTLAPDMKIDDGLLDVFVMKKGNLEGLIQLARQMIGLEKNPLGEVLPWLDERELVRHWTAADVKVKSDPVMDIQVDGDVIAKTPSHILVKPGALRVVIPKE